MHMHGVIPHPANLHASPSDGMNIVHSSMCYQILLAHGTNKNLLDWLIYVLYMTLNQQNV